MEYFFDENRFMPHGHCYFWEPYLLWSHAIADAIIALAYFLIPIVLIYIYRKRNDLRYKWIVGFFAVFILGCGITHVFDIINIWKPLYYLDSVFRILTAIASLGTAIALFNIHSDLLRIPTSQQWHNLNNDLRNTIQKLEEKEKIIQSTNRELHKQVELLHLAQQLSQAGSYEINFEEGFTTGSPQLHKIFGLPTKEAGNPINISFFYEKVHPDDMNYIKEKMKEAVDTGQVPELSYRIVIDDKIKHIVVKSIDFTNKEGKRVSYGCTMDVTERKENQLKLQKLNQELATSNEELAASTEELGANNEQLIIVNQKLSELQEELEKRVSERTLELQQTSRELHVRNEELDQYVYKVSHDIRAPISSISGLVSLMKEEENPPATQEYLNLIENRIAKLDDFIRSVLNYSKILNTSADKITINFESIVQKCLDELTYYPDAKKLKVNTQVLTGKKYIGDELRLLIVFKNMISNAIKYRNKNIESYLHIIIDETEQGFKIRFEDNGIGIEEKHHEKIFQMFFRATSLSDGSGLGLYIVKQAVEKMKGKMTVKSDLDSGTTFTLDLPDSE